MCSGMNHQLHLVPFQFILLLSFYRRENTVLRSHQHPKHVSAIPNAIDASQFQPDPSARPNDKSKSCYMYLQTLNCSYTSMNEGWARWAPLYHRECINTLLYIWEFVFPAHMCVDNCDYRWPLILSLFVNLLVSALFSNQQQMLTTFRYFKLI